MADHLEVAHHRLAADALSKAAAAHHKAAELHNAGKHPEGKRESRIAAQLMMEAAVKSDTANHSSMAVPGPTEEILPVPPTSHQPLPTSGPLPPSEPVEIEEGHATVEADSKPARRHKQEKI